MIGSNVTPDVTLKYFRDHSEIFGWWGGDMTLAIPGRFDHDANDDLNGEVLPDTREPIYTDPSRPAVLKYRDVSVSCPTLGEAVSRGIVRMVPRKYIATITIDSGDVFTGATIFTSVDQTPPA